MNKQYFIELADYNIWANDICLSWLQQINNEQWTQTIVSSFNSIQETVLHIISAETAWLQRFQKKEKVVWLQTEYKGTKDEHIALWKDASKQLKEYIESFDETKISDLLMFKRFNGEENTMKYYEVFAHAFNHSTYHRGQVVTMLRQAGFTGVQSTDLLGYYRIKQQTKN
ncbi:DinB family protein [Ferruginibacter albus]|uniref:DinB family protein n=1 Tax=Ferruginibacter albus TaxID=2875540 RepID=UPI001CC80628|nr:DinB family protein [Ferruginibacter albus]UAY53005.1 DinB family protein [Ferruginibacter albus]